MTTEEEWEAAAAEYRKVMENTPLEIVCSQHGTTREEVKRLRNENHCTFRAIASHTSDKECESPICGEALCRDAGADI